MLHQAFYLQGVRSFWNSLNGTYSAEMSEWAGYLVLTYCHSSRIYSLS